MVGLIVQKFGGTSVGTLERIAAVALRCIATQEQGHEVVVVVSAMAGETNRLLAMAHAVHPRPNPRETDVLVATGEQVSIALVAMAIEAAGGKARSFLGDQIGMRTDARHGKARILSIDDAPLRRSLADGEIAVVAGFQGVDETGAITTLGRGGSDTSAVALAAALHGDCEIFTDVDGIYTTDPRIHPRARKLEKVAYDEMLELASLGAKVLQTRSVEFALNHRVRLHVRSSFVDVPGTWLVPEEEMMEKAPVRGIALDKDCAKITIKGVPARAGTAAALFRPLADRSVNVDVIVQTTVEDGFTNLAFTVSRSELDLALDVAGQAAASLGARQVLHDPCVVKVSAVGAGMQTQPGVAAQVFEALAHAGISIDLISTSEIKITCVVNEKDAHAAVIALHDSFGLHEPS